VRLRGDAVGLRGPQLALVLGLSSTNTYEQAGVIAAGGRKWASGGVNGVEIEGWFSMYELLRPVMRGWYAKQMLTGGSLPKPMDEPTVRADAPDADQVLLLGNGPLHGWGVLTHQMSITGHLARLTRVETGRPCTVHYIGDETMSIESARAWIGTHDVSAYDVVVIAIGMNDAVRLTPLKVWAEKYRALLDFLTAQVKLSARIVVAGLEPVRSVTVFNHWLGELAEFHAGRMSTILDQITADFSAATYFRFPGVEVDPARPHGSSDIYRLWAQNIAPYLRDALSTVRHNDAGPRAERAEQQFNWSGTQRLIEQAADGGSEELQRLAGVAKDTFGVDIAAVTLLDGDRLWFAVNTKQLPKSIPRELAYCNTVVQEDAPLVVADAQKDSRFKGNPFVDITGMDFYAGHPIRSSTGETIGSFCLLNSTPRATVTVSMDALAMLAGQAELELRRYEQPRVTATTVSAP
jgi:hypothetical protein